MSNNTPGWAVELTGDPLDLNDFRGFLASPFNPWIEDFWTDDGLKTILRSVDWANLTEASDVVRDARRILNRLNGEALLLHSDAKPLSLGQVMRFGPDGKREPILFAATAQFQVTLGRVRFRATATTGKPEVPNTPRESLIQKWFREAEADDVRADLFDHIRRADNWYDVYKSMELARRLVGGSQALSVALGPDQKEWNRIWQTANCYRHAPDPATYPLPNPAVDLEPAREFVLKVIPRLL